MREDLVRAVQYEWYEALVPIVKYKGRDCSPEDVYAYAIG